MGMPTAARRALLLSLLIAGPTLARTKSKTIKSAPAPSAAVIHYSPPADAIDERPIPTEISVTPEGNDFAVRMTFNKTPWGEACKSHCANATVFIDTDNNLTTGLAIGNDRPESGADLAVIIQGAREYKEKSADSFLKAKVKFFSGNPTNVEQGDTLSESDHRNDPDRVQSDGTQVFVLVDATDLSIPSGKTIRIIYHPPGEKPLEATGKGMVAHGTGKIDSYTKKGKHRKRH